MTGIFEGTSGGDYDPDDALVLRTSSGWSAAQFVDLGSTTRVCAGLGADVDNVPEDVFLIRTAVGTTVLLYNENEFRVDDVGVRFDLTGSDIEAWFSGGNHGDYLAGGSASDLLQGRGGADTLIGGDGNDTVSYADSAQGVSVNLWTGAASGGDAAGDSLVLVENLVGSAHADTLTGNRGDNLLTGGDGNDSLNGGAGADTLMGSYGNDTLDGRAGADSLVGSYGNTVFWVDSDDVISGESGTRDVVYARGNWTTPADQGIERLVAAPSSDGVLLGGTEFDEAIIGGKGGDTLSSFAGNDTLNGRDGDDLLVGGGGGVDHLTGGAGNDTFAFLDAVDSEAGPDRARIRDFATGDVIDLSAIDAIAGGTDDDFSFIGGAAFGGNAGELRAYAVGGNTMVAADLDGDRFADMQVLLIGSHTLASGDFDL